MSADVRTVAAAEEGCHLFGDNKCGFNEVSPDAGLFFPTPWLDFGLPATSGLTKYVLVLGVAVVLVLAFWYFTTRKASVVPGRAQSIAEMLITFLRDQVVRQSIDKKEGDKYMPLMITLFLFIFAMNIMGLIPGLQLPVTSNLAYPAVLALFVFVLWNAVGVRHHGARTHFIGKMVPGDAPKWILPLLVPLEFVSNFLFRPFTHAIRLFATMLAGHLLLAVFAAAGFYMFNPSAGLALGSLSVGYSAVALIAFLVFTAFELFIMALQAYVFVMLASSYIGEAIEGPH